MMDVEILILFIRIFLGCLFISTGLSKIRNLNEHILLIEEYEILPKAYIKTFALLNVSLEVIVGVFLLLGLLQKYVSLIGVFLLTVYSLGVIINLLRGKSNISCGCGGSLESNHLSWPLIIRNLIFIIFFLFTYTFETKMGNVQFILMDQSLNHIYSYDLVITVLLAFSTWIVFLIILKFNDLRLQLKKLLSE